MSDIPTDDEMRDSLGDDLVGALGSFDRARHTADVADVVSRNARRIRNRRRAVAFAGVVVTVAIVGIVVASRDDTTSGVANVAPTTGQPPTTVARGFKVVSYGGVQVEVPAGWPVVDGMHTGFCEGAFPELPTAFIGPQDNVPPSCPSLPSLRTERRDGVWLFPSQPDDPSVVVRNAAGTELRQYTGASAWPVKTYFVAGIAVEIGEGPNATSIINSIHRVPGAPDSPAQGVCARNRDADRMPAPERLATTLVLEKGDFTLAPPRRGDVARVEPAKVWASGGQSRPNYLRYRLILARFSSKYPANPGPNGYEPVNRDVLAWVVYSVPMSADVTGCGMWGLHVVNATTGIGIIDAGYAPGP